MPAPDDFFNNTQRLASKIKTDIITKYFKAWLDIMVSRSPGGRVGYVDLFCGPGQFQDEAGEVFPSTPLKILDQMQSDPALTRALSVHFNDAKSEYTQQLAQTLSEHPAWPNVAQRVSITTQPMTAAALRSHVLPYPALYFLDPFGYGGFSLDDVNAVVRQHGNDLLFFFNYNRFNPELSHPNDIIRRQPVTLLGEASHTALQNALAGQQTAETRKQIITNHLWRQLELGGIPQHYVVPFEFKFSDRDRTSHFLVFVSKNAVARKIIRDVMAGLRTDRAGGSFEFNPHDPAFDPGNREQGLFGNHFALGDELVKMFSGQCLSVTQIISRRDLACPRSPYIGKDYKTVLKQLRQEGALSAIRPNGKAVIVHQMPDDALVTFLPG